MAKCVLFRFCPRARSVSSDEGVGKLVLDDSEARPLPLSRRMVGSRFSWPGVGDLAILVAREFATVDGLLFKRAMARHENVSAVMSTVPLALLKWISGGGRATRYGCWRTQLTRFDVYLSQRLWVCTYSEDRRVRVDVKAVMRRSSWSWGLVVSECARPGRDSRKFDATSGTRWPGRAACRPD